MRVVVVHFVAGIIFKKKRCVKFPEIVGWFVYRTSVPPEVLSSQNCQTQNKCFVKGWEMLDALDSHTLVLRHLVCVSEPQILLIPIIS